ncbi:PREDICTED: somatostatin receptor type 2-like [Branchiostoma belcheri]|uniref:Somatostatin receptor type 2-like n=1 Tax=Branchiostoma belcheri TaxID=7741 RepID=A0A6P4ZZF4_BRABE|nr:PREDICTED: somatostatin receptor type 2-like [Branchiostoma belcheri]
MTIADFPFANETDPEKETLVLASDIITKIVAPSVYGVEIFAGLLGNALVMYMLLGFTKMKDSTHYYILNLAVADTLFMLGVPFISISSAMERWVFGQAMCKIVMSMDAMNMFTTVFNLAVLSVDRYLAIVCSTSHPELRQPKVAAAVSLSVWFTAILLSIPVMTASENVLTEHGHYVCILNWPASEAMFRHKVFTSYTFVVGFLVPFGIIITSYLLVIRHLKSSTSEHAAVSRVSVRMRTKVTKTVTAMVATFAVCRLPFHVCQLVLLASEPRPTLGTLVMFHLAMVMSYANSCVNPVLYVFTSQKFRDSFRAALRLSGRRARQEYGRRQREGLAAAARNRQLGGNGFLQEERCEVNITMLPYSTPERLETTV